MSADNAFCWRRIPTETAIITARTIAPTPRIILGILVVASDCQGG
jgi:hypothetical protein